MAQYLVLWFLLLLLATTPALVLSQLAPTASDMAPPPPMPECPDMCGKIHIPYPFGIGEGCARPGVDSFTITCNHSFNPPRPYVGNGNIEIIDISLEAGEVRVYTPVASICNNGSAKEQRSVTTNLGSPFVISPERNEFTAIGCETLAFLKSGENWGDLSGCMTSCESVDGAARDGEPCTGLGCCRTSSISRNLSSIKIGWGNIDAGKGTVDNNPAWKYSPCSYAFVAESGWREDLNGIGDKAFNQRGERSIPRVLDWAITGNGTCTSQSKNPTACACVSAHSYCVNKATQRPGYLCNCSAGYQGNPYVSGGCKNIDECKLRISDPKTYEKLYPCQSGSTCHDTDGDYECKCNFWQRGDGKSDKGCRAIFPGYAVAIVAISTAGLLLVILLCWFLRREHKRRQLRRFFNKNGGQILNSMNINIYTKEQLDKITQNYSTNIGNGAFGMVYMGTTDDNNQVAVKRSTVQGQTLQQGDFLNEITVQFRINHTNLVRLVGCCLETDVPMLVFEFIANGSLYQVLHGAEKRALPLPARLNIAIGSAEALSYMHSLDGHNIVHGDIKSGNILLGDNFMPKVSDFGSSKLVSVTRFANWSVMGDMNYIDPVYIKTGQFTEKSDVYSFGVVLLELITRKKAKYDGNNSLPINFAKSYKEEGTRREMYDKEILYSVAQPDHCMKCLDSIGGIAVQCLKEDVGERPTMTHVLDELKLVKLRVGGVQVMGND